MSHAASEAGTSGSMRSESWARMMTKDEARQFTERWRLVNEFVTEEVRRTPPEVKLRQLAVLYEAGRTLGWTEKLAAGEDEVRERWRVLKEKLGVRI